MTRRLRTAPKHSFYADLGRSIRLARMAAGKTQSDAAEHVDVSFQQFQKYENGTNRIPVDKLIALAAWVKVPVAQLLALSETDAAWQSLTEQFRANGFQTLLESWAEISDKPMRAAILNLVKRAADLSG
jgi:transcriptional regulator with XRE-family HTH domain